MLKNNKKDPRRVAAGKKAYQNRKKRDPDGVAEFHVLGGINSGGQFDKDQLLAKAAGSIGGKASTRRLTKPAPCGASVDMDGYKAPFLVETDNPEEATDD